MGLEGELQNEQTQPQPMAETDVGQGQTDDQQQTDDGQQQDDDGQQGKPTVLTQEEVDRIVRNRLAKQERAHQRELERERALRDAILLRGGQQQQQPAPQQTQDAEPQRDDFNTYEEYVRALGRWEGRQAARSTIEEANVSRRVQTEQERFEALARDFSQREDKARERIDDYDDVVSALPPLGRAVAEFVGESEHGPDVLYALASDPKLVSRIRSLSPSQQTRELARLEARFAAGGATNKQQSNAPAPVRGLTPKQASTDDAPRDSDDIDTWRRKEIKRQRKLGMIP